MLMIQFISIVCATMASHLKLHFSWVQVSTVHFNAVGPVLISNAFLPIYAHSYHYNMLLNPRNLTNYCKLRN